MYVERGEVPGLVCCRICPVTSLECTCKSVAADGLRPHSHSPTCKQNSFSCPFRVPQNNDANMDGAQKHCAHPATLMGCPACQLAYALGESISACNISLEADCDYHTLDQTINETLLKNSGDTKSAGIEYLTTRRDEAKARCKMYSKRHDVFKTQALDLENSCEELLGSRLHPFASTVDIILTEVVEQDAGVWDDAVDANKKAWGQKMEDSRHSHSVSADSTSSAHLKDRFMLVAASAPLSIEQRPIDLGYDRTKIYCTDDFQLDSTKAMQGCLQIGWDSAKELGPSHRTDQPRMPVGTTWQEGVLGIPQRIQMYGTDESSSTSATERPDEEYALRKAKNDPRYNTKSTSDLTVEQQRDMFRPGTFLLKHTDALASYYAANNNTIALRQPKEVAERRETFAKLHESVIRNSHMFNLEELSIADTPRALIQRNEPVMNGHSMVGFTAWLQEWKNNCGSDAVFEKEIQDWRDSRSSDQQEFAPKMKDSEELPVMAEHTPSQFEQSLVGPNTLALQSLRKPGWKKHGRRY